MGEPKSILLLEGNAEHIQYPLYTNGGDIRANHNLIEAENKLNQVFEEYTGRIESFMLMLDVLKESVLIINQAGELRFANEPGNILLNDADWSGQILNCLNYRELAAEEVVLLNNDKQQAIQVRINNFFLNGEQCNILVVEKTAPVPKQQSIQVASRQTEPFEVLLNYVQLIADHEANGKINEAVACAELAAKTVLQSEKLITDIKTFIALAHHQPVLTKVSMQNIAGDVLKSMGPEIEEAEIEVSISELPETTADKELINKLLKHLISNALKFRNKARKAVIDIGHDKNDGQFIFCVRDNGIGISKKHHEQVFNLFSTLNDTKEYPGNGMGLAICKKIVELHNGKIWAESLPGHGSNFYFKLNAK